MNYISLHKVFTCLSEAVATYKIYRVFVCFGTCAFVNRYKL